MRGGARVEGAIVRTVRVAIALLMLPILLMYAAAACVVYPVALVVTAFRPAAPRPVPVRVPA